MPDESHEPIPISRGSEIELEANYVDPFGLTDLDIATRIVKDWKGKSGPFGARTTNLVSRMLSQSTPQVEEPSELGQAMQNSWRIRFAEILGTIEYADREFSDDDAVGKVLEKIISDIERGNQFSEIMDVLSLLHKITAYDDLRPTTVIDIALIQKVVAAAQREGLIILATKNT